MTDSKPSPENSKPFTTENVLVAVSRELRIPIDQLRIAFAPPVKTGEATDAVLVTSSVTSLSLTVHRNQAKASERYVKTIADWLANGLFFRFVEPTRDLFKAVIGSCDLSGLVPWITSAVSQGWLSEKPVKGEVRTLEGIKEEIQVKVKELLTDYEAAVYMLCERNLEHAISVVVEQCPFDERKLCEAILGASGGWEAFTESHIVARMEEGFLAESENAWTDEYMTSIYESQSSR